MTDRDQFAAAALTGLTTMTPGGVYPLDDLAQQAYATADAMLRERERTFDAKPRELSDDQKTLRNAADVLGPGGFKNLANELLSLSRRLTDAYAKDCKKCNVLHTKRASGDRPQPINGPDPDSRVWETPVHTQPTHATPGEGSVQGDCTEPQPTLTDAERDAVETAALEADAHQHTQRAATLRGLIERLS